jgi:primary-amine oxidase
MEVDGPDNEVYEVDAVPPPRPRIRGGNAFAAAMAIHPAGDGAGKPAGSSMPSRSRSWKVVNGSSFNRLGQPTAYKLVPGQTPTLLADPTRASAKRAAFATHNCG